MYVYKKFEDAPKSLKQCLFSLFTTLIYASTSISCMYLTTYLYKLLKQIESGLAKTQAQMQIRV